jgi:hypothetical protein
MNNRRIALCCFYLVIIFQVVAIANGVSQGPIFGIPSTYATGGSLPSSMATVDVNADGKLDLLVANDKGENGRGTIGVRAKGVKRCSVVIADLTEWITVPLENLKRHLFSFTPSIKGRFSIFTWGHFGFWKRTAEKSKQWRMRVQSCGHVTALHFRQPRTIWLFQAACRS